MALATLLTPERLHALAGYGYARGARYAEQGRVISYEVRDDVLEGIVAGSDDYRVRILANARSLVADCTCPAAQREAMCKHAVALALHHLAAGSRPVRAPVPIDDVRPVFETAGELVAYAERHQVDDELRVCADVLLPELEPLDSSMSYLLARWSLRDIGSHEGARLHLQGARFQRGVASAARQRLERAAGAVRDGLVEDPPATVADPAFQPMRERLLDLRRDLRRGAVPRSRAGAPGQLRFDPRITAMVWDEPIKHAGKHAMFSFVRVSATLSLVPHTKIACTCGVEGACTHQIALVEAALASLADPVGVDDRRRMVEELLRPSWQRALAELATVAAPAARASAEIEVWWHVEHELRTLTLTPIIKRRLKKGTFSAGSRITVARLVDDHGSVLSDHDLRIAEHLLAWDVGGRSTYPVRAFAALVGHPRVASEDGEHLVVTKTKLGFTALQADDQIRLEPTVDGARFSPRLLGPLLTTFAAGEPLVVVEPEHGRCRLIDVSDDASRLWTVLVRHGDTFPPESHGALIDRLAGLDRALPIVVPEGLMGARLDEPLVTVVRLRLDNEAKLELEPFVRVAAGAPLYPPGAGPRDVMISRDGTRVYVRRRLESELERVHAALAALPLEGAEEGPPMCFRFDDPERALAVVAAVQQPPPGIEAEWIDTRARVLASGGPRALRVQIDRDRDWFGLAGMLAVEGGRIELAVILDAVRRQQRFVRVDAHRWIELSETLRDSLVGLADRSFAGRGNAGLEVSPAAVPAVRALVEAGAEVTTAPTWQLLADKLEASTRLRPRPPAALEATLRPYQVEGHAWLSRLAAWGAGGCLADDMGLGKTVQAIAMLLDRAKLGPALVLAPTSVSLNWVEELRRFAPSLRPIVYGERSDREGVLATLGKKDILIASYGLLQRDAGRFATRRFATLVADEAQALKNPNTARARAARALDAEFRIAMSGTPLENHLGELWSLYAIVFPGLLGSWDQFRARFAMPIERDRNPEARAALSRLLRPFLLRRTKQEVAPELPPRTEIVVPVALSSDEAELYNDARLAALAELGREKPKVRDEHHRFQVLAALTRLRLLASHPKLYDPSSPVASSKMQRLLELAFELRSEGHRVLVFSQFTSHLALVRGELERAGFSLLYLDGATPTRTRADLIRRFQAGEGDAFLISLKAGGTGINLTGADYVIHLDPWWNPAVEDQATDRAHRIGQTKPVTVYRLITRGTVEDKILALHATKRSLVAGILEGSDAAAKLTVRDLIELLGDR